MKILSSQQIRSADEFTIVNEPIPSIDLMERASKVFVNWYKDYYNNSNPVLIYCGPGNNGGDGLAIARLLYQDEYQVKVVIVKFGKGTSEDFLTNLKRLQERTTVEMLIVENENNFPVINENDVIIDAILGSGLTRPAIGFVENAIVHLNNNAKKIVSVDIPSGLFSDSFTSSASVSASRTLSFEFPKLAFFLPSNGEQVGKWDFRSIGLDKQFIAGLESSYHLITEDVISSIYRPRKKFDHKGSFGHSLIIGGAKGKIGAAVLAAKGALRSGTGLLTMRIPSCGFEILQSTVPESMVLADKSEFEVSSLPPIEDYKAIGIGPGIGGSNKTSAVLKELIFGSAIPLVIDADGLNILSQNQDWIKKLPKKSILTPHPKEFERLFGKTENDFERINLLKEKAKTLGVFLILKGAHTAIGCPDGQIWFNKTGNPGMGTGGSGDVLTGVLTGLLAQGYSSFQASVLGVYLHGLAGDMASRELSEEALIASDIADYLGKAFNFIKTI